MQIIYGRMLTVPSSHMMLSIWLSLRHPKAFQDCSCRLRRDTYEFAIGLELVYHSNYFFKYMLCMFRVVSLCDYGLFMI